MRLLKKNNKKHTKSKITKKNTNNKKLNFGNKKKYKLIPVAVFLGILGAYFAFRSFAYTPNLEGNDGKLVTVNQARMHDISLNSNQVKVISVTGKNGVPKDNVKSVVINVSAISPEENGTLKIFNASSANTGPSSLRFDKKVSVSSQVTVKVSSDGEIKILNNSNGETRVLVDITGFISNKNGPIGSRYNNVIQSTLHNTEFGPEETKTIKVAGRNGIPSNGVDSVAVNISAISPPEKGTVTIFRADRKIKPGTPLLRYSKGNPGISNQAIVRISSSGEIKVSNNGGKTRIKIDITGYFSVEQAGFENVQDGRFVQVSQKEIHDITLGEDKTSENLWTVFTKEEVKAVLVNISSVESTENGLLTAYAANKNTKPSTPIVRYKQGSPTINQAIIKVNKNGQFKLHNSAGRTRVKIDIIGYYIHREPYAVYQSVEFGGLASKAATKIERTFNIDSISNASDTSFDLGHSPYESLSLVGGLSVSSIGFNISSEQNYIRIYCSIFVDNEDKSCNMLDNEAKKYHSTDLYTIYDIPHNFTKGKYTLVNKVQENVNGRNGKWIQHSLVLPNGSIKNLYVEYFGSELEASFNNGASLTTKKYSCSDNTPTIIRLGNIKVNNSPFETPRTSVRNYGSTCNGIGKVEVEPGSSSNENLYKFTFGVKTENRDITPPKITELYWDSTTSELKLKANEESGIIIDYFSDQYTSTNIESIGNSYYGSTRTIDSVIAWGQHFDKGENQVTIEVTDNSGNTGRKTINFIVD